ncbi:hypothetical protein [Azospirillum sp. sgz302134]
MTEPQLPDIVKKADLHIPPRDGAALVTIETRSRRTLPRRPRFRLPHETWECFHVDTRRTAAIGPIRHRIEDFQNDRRVELKIAGRARCIEKEETKTVAALHGESGVTATFETLLLAAIDDELRDREGTFIAAFTSEAPELAKSLQELARKEWGLKLNLKIGLDNDELLGPMTIGPRPFTVSTFDCFREVAGSLSAELGVLKTDPVAALTNMQKPDELTESLVQTIRQHCRESVTLHQIYFDRDAVLSTLREKLTVIIREHGRNPERLVVTFADPEFNTNTVELINKTAYQPNRIAGTIHVESTIRLTLINASQYVNAGAPNLEVWLRDQLRQIIGNHLFDADYVDLVLGWEALEQQIQSDLDISIKGIGYELRALISAPDLPDRRLAEFNDVHVDVDTFATKLPAEVKIDTVVTLRVRDLSLIRDRLVRREDILQEIKRRATAELRRIIRTIEPERFYMEFADGNGRPAVQDLLAEAIRTGLCEEFPADIRQISIRPLDDAITLRLIRLRALPAIDFEVEVATVGKIGTEPVTLSGAFRIGGVDPAGWHDFQSLTDETDGEDYIRRRLVGAIVSGLQVKDRDVLLFDTEAKQAQVREWIQTILEDAALRMFGLSVSLLYVRRDQTLTETTYGDYLRAEIEVEKQRIETVKAVGIDHYTAIAERHRNAQDVQTSEIKARLMDAEEAKAAKASALAELRAPMLPPSDLKGAKKPATDKPEPDV